MLGSTALHASPTLALGARAAAMRRAGADVLSVSTPSFLNSVAPVPIPPAAALLGDPAGEPALRDLARDRLFGGWSLPQHGVMVTAGAKAALHAVLRHLLRPGDRVGIVTPAWPSYTQLVGLLYAEPVPIPTQLADGWLPAPEAIGAAAAAPGAPMRALILSNPANPTGRVLDGAALDSVLVACAGLGVACILDESFSAFRFGAARDNGARPVPPDSTSLYVVNSFSKNFAVQGYRLGAALIPREGWQPVLAAHQAVSSAASSAAQAALLALEAAGQLRTPDIAPQRDATLAFIAAAGWACHPTQGGFYAFPRLPDLALLNRFERAGLLALDGAAFGGDPRHIRLCFARPMTELMAMLSRMQAVL